jgi:hypothetical protein
MRYVFHIVIFSILILGRYIYREELEGELIANIAWTTIVMAGAILFVYQIHKENKRT